MSSTSIERPEQGTVSILLEIVEVVYYFQRFHDIHTLKGGWVLIQHILEGFKGWHSKNLSANSPHPWGF